MKIWNYIMCGLAGSGIIGGSHLMSTPFVWVAIILVPVNIIIFLVHLKRVWKND